MAKRPNQATLKRRRALSELYTKGVEVRFSKNGFIVGQGPGGDEFDEPLSDDQIQVWVAPPNPLQREEAMRNAQAKRSLALIRARTEQTSPEYLTAKAFLTEMSFETLVEYVLQIDRDERNAEARRDVLADKQWEDVDALRDALRQFEEQDKAGELDYDDPDYKALMDRDAQYAAQVSQREGELMDAARDSLAMLGRERLEAKAMEQRVTLAASQSFLSEYELQMSFFAVRDIDDHDVLFFESAADLSKEHEVIRKGIADAVATFISDGSEAKN